MFFQNFTTFEWFLLVQHELLLFAAVFFAIGTLDEIAVDLCYFWLRLTGRAVTPQIDERTLHDATLAGRAAIFIPAWHEAPVIGSTLDHALAVWAHEQAVFYVGCYRNDPTTIAAVSAAASADPRVRLVISASDGPTSKPDCLNRLYAALCEDEERMDEPVRMVVLHDAEDMVDPVALAVLDHAMWTHDFVQLPVLALPQPGSRWIGTHYSDEFAEAHGKAMVVRSALSASVPGAGVGSAIARPMLERLARSGTGNAPFAHQSLTEDYELGLRVAALGGSGQFLRLRTKEGRLVATRAFFPSDLSDAVRQKTRWMHGIALQSWDRLGWSGSPFDFWMQLRDRRGPFAAFLLAVAYVIVMLLACSALLATLGIAQTLPLTPLVEALLFVNLGGFLWRVAMRMMFSAREHGWGEGVLAAPRMLVSNVIAIMAGHRAIAAYVRTLRGAPVVWDKTEHHHHPLVSQGASKHA